MIRRFLGLESRAITFQDVWGKSLEYFGLATASGEPVTADSAMRTTAVWGAVRILSEGVSTLPIDTFVRKDGVRLPFRPRPAWLDMPMDEFGRIEFLGQCMVSLLLRGNAYAFITRDRIGDIQELLVLDPDQVSVRRVNQTAVGGPGTRLIYTVGGVDGLTSHEVLHVPGLMLPGDVAGLDPILYHRETIGLTQAATKYGAAFFGNSAVPAAVVEMPEGKSMAKEAQSVFRSQWDALHRGAGRSSKIAILTEGAKLRTISLTPEQSQFLQTRQFQVSDIARIFGVPPHLLADASGSTSWGSGLAEQNTAFAQHVIRPWAERIEAALTRAMLSEGANPRAFVKLNLDAVMRGDLKSRMEAYAIGLDKRIYTVNEVRAKEDLPPLPGGDEFPKPPPPVSPGNLDQPTPAPPATAKEPAK